MKKLITVLTILLFLLAGCNESKQQDEGFITVDVTKSYPEKEIILQDLFDVEYIPLESTEEFITTASMQGISEDVILLKDGNISGTDNIFLFGRDGKGINKFSRLGQGREEYTIALGVVLNEEEDELFVNSHMSRKVMVYDRLGNFKRGFKQKEDSWYDEMGNFDQNYLICHDGAFNVRGDQKKKNYFLLISKQDGSIKEIPIPYEKKIVPKVTGETTTGPVTYYIYNSQQVPFQDKWIISEPSADTIYTYSQDHVLAPFIVRTPSIQSMEVETFLFAGVQTERYNFMQTVKKEFDLEKETGFPTKDLVYDREENAIYECAVYNDDFVDKKLMSLVYEIPVPPAVINNSEVAFMTRLFAHDLIEAYENGKLRGRLKEIAANLEEEDNPVIMIAKHKK